MSDAFIESPAEPAEGDKLQLWAALLLGLAATLTALSAYKAALADGDALQGYSQSNRLLSDANAFYAQGNSQSNADQSIFTEYAVALQSGNAELADYLTTLMRPELVEAVEWWQNTEEAVTPFDESDENPYTIQDFVEASDLEDEAEKTYNEGAEADELGDKFELATVLMALTLFFAGVATLFSRKSASVVLLAVAAVTLVAGGVQLVVAFGG